MFCFAIDRRNKNMNVREFLINYSCNAAEFTVRTRVQLGEAVYSEDNWDVYKNMVSLIEKRYAMVKYGSRSSTSN